jgi:glycosyltransferase involved in cell wall biosynthesis
VRLLFVSQASPAREGGAETRTREVAIRLAHAGHQVTVLCGKTHAGDPDELDLQGVRVLACRVLPDALLRRFPHPHYFPLAAANLLLMFHLARLLRRERFDLLREDVAPFPPTFLLALLALPVARRVAVTHMLPNGLREWIGYYGAAFGTAGYLMARLLRAGVLRHDRVVCAARWFAEELKRSPALAAKVRYVPNGVDFERFAGAGTPRAAANPGASRLLCVGRLVETKGHRHAIDALARLKHRHPGLRLDIVGAGPLRGALLDLARRLGVGERVQIVAPVGHAEMPALYRGYDFFVMPSLWEGQPVSLIEAMASRLPVIATDMPSITDVLDARCGTLFAREDAADLAAQLDWAIANPAAVRERAERACESARRYDWSATAGLELQAYAE